MTKTSLGKRLRSLRLQMGMTQSEVAERIGIKGHAQVSMWENGVVLPGCVTLLRFLDILRDEFDDQAEFLLFEGVTFEETVKQSGSLMASKYIQRAQAAA